MTDVDELEHWRRWLEGWGPGESWNDRFGRPEGERRLEEYRIATGLGVLAYHLVTCSDAELEEQRTKVASAFASDPKTRDLILALIDTKLAGAIWGPAHSRLIHRAHQLEDRAARPRSCATFLALIPGGRRWRPMHYRRPR
jgi:hypothetical protein